MNPAPKRISPIHVPDEYRLPDRPEVAPDSVLDAFRQTQFVLGGELRLFAEAMTLQLQIMRDAYPSQYRTLALAGIAGSWSRAYQCLADAALLLSRASYGSTLPLLLSATEMIAAEEAVRGDGGLAFAAWSERTLTSSRDHAAFEFEIGRFEPAAAMESDPDLGGLHRVLSDFGQPYFGATLLLVAPESNNQRLAITFADATFHLGWAEMVLGWMLQLSRRQIRVIRSGPSVFPMAAEVALAADELGERIEAALSREDRCHVEEIRRGPGDVRYLIHNFRRTSGGAPKKILL